MADHVKGKDNACILSIDIIYDFIVQKLNLANHVIHDLLESRQITGQLKFKVLSTLIDILLAHTYYMTNNKSISNTLMNNVISEYKSIELSKENEGFMWETFSKISTSDKTAYETQASNSFRCMGINRIVTDNKSWIEDY